MSNLYPRKITPLLTERIRSRKVTLLTGARQTGKTTLVRDILPEHGDFQIAYFNLDDPDERIRLSENPARSLDIPDKVVVLDEIQKLPALLDVVKLLADRTEGPRFLLLGSSQVLLLKQVRETLAGRITLLHLWQLAVGEKVSAPEAPRITMDNILDEGEAEIERLSQSPPSPSETRTLRERCNFILRWGGFPPVEEMKNDQQRRIWLRDYRNTYLERDLSDLGRVSDLDQFARAQSILAARTGQLMSYSEVARDLGVAANTVKKYVRFLEMSFQGELVPPYSPNVAKRLIKSPKFYWLDAGLARVLSERYNLNDGAIYESFVAGELMKWLSWQEDSPHMGFFRTAAGAEVDLVVWTDSRLFAIEVKASENVHPGSARSIGHFFEKIIDSGDERKLLGLVVYRGVQIRRLNEKIWAIPDWVLFGGINMYYCRFTNYQRTSGNLDDFVEYQYNFVLVPEEKVGQPDEKHNQKALAITVRCSGSQAAIWGLDRDHPDMVKILYWLGRERIREGQALFGVANEYAWEEFPDEFKNEPPDVSRISFPPPKEEGFLTQISNGKPIGFHQ